MKPSRPTVVLVTAIFHLIVGGLGLLCGVCTSAQMAGGQQLMAMGNPQQAQVQQQLEKSLAEKIPGYMAYQVGNVVIWLIFGVALVAAGIGLLGMKSWARRLSLWYAVLSLVHKVVWAAYSVVYLVPAQEAAFRSFLAQQAQQAPAGPQAQQATQMLEMIISMTKISTIAAPFVMMVYPVVVLLLLGRPSVGRDFGGGAPLTARGADDYTDDAEGRWGRS